jgi:hypothetical protein
MDQELRKKIWLALSDFYIDAELQDADYQSVFMVLKESGLSLTELRNIDRFEVWPALNTNLLDIAGEWIGFNHKQIVELCMNNFNRKHENIFRVSVKLKRLFSFRMTDKHWEKMELLFGEKNRLER